MCRFFSCVSNILDYLKKIDTTKKVSELPRYFFIFNLTDWFKFLSGGLENFIFSCCSSVKKII